MGRHFGLGVECLACAGSNKQAARFETFRPACAILVITTTTAGELFCGLRGTESGGGSVRVHTKNGKLCFDLMPPEMLLLFVVGTLVAAFWERGKCAGGSSRLLH